MGIQDLTDFLSRIQVLEPDVTAARQPARQYGAALAEDASNLADALARVRLRDQDSWEPLISELGRCLPGLVDVELVPVGGPTRAVTVQLIEQGVAQPIDLADASYGTVRMLATYCATVHAGLAWKAVPQQPPIWLVALPAVSETRDLFRQHDTHRVVEPNESLEHELPVPGRALAAMREI